MIDINASNKTNLKFSLNVENTTRDPKSIRFIIPIKEGLNLMVEGTQIGKEIVVNVPPIGNIIEGDIIKGAKLEVVLNEQGNDVIFEAAQTDINIVRPIKINAELSSTSVEAIEADKPVKISAAISQVQEVAEEIPVEEACAKSNKSNSSIWDKVKSKKKPIKENTEDSEFGTLDCEF